MKHARLAFGIGIATLFLAANVSAATIFTANLNGAQEPSPSTGTGFATVILNDAMTQLDVTLTFTGLSTPDVAAHIHCCAPPGSNAGIVVPFTGIETGVTSLTTPFTHTFNLATDVTGITPTAFTAGLLSELAYVNVHTTDFPGGEIRGQLDFIPEPGTFALLLLALSGFFLIRRGAGRKTLP